MSITAETCKEHAKDPAVLCCRAEAGIVIGPENLEDPAIFDDLVDSGLLKLDGCLTIEEASQPEPIVPCARPGALPESLWCVCSLMPYFFTFRH